MPALLLALCLLPHQSLAQEARPDITRVSVDSSRAAATVPDGLYGVGYDGWGDITSPQAVEHLKAVGVRYCRIDANLGELCGSAAGELNLDYTTPRDGGLGFSSRVQRIVQNGWVPIVALSTSFALPRWFHGDATDAAGKPWTAYNLDGSPARESLSDQYAALERVTRELTEGLARRGLRGLHWETIYEIGHTMPMAQIHYYAARGIREADAGAKLMGPATWPGWTVSERFYRPFAREYGVDLLDFVTVHWYASNEHGLWDLGYKPGEDIITMADRAYLECLMETAPRLAQWCRELRVLLCDRELNPTGKRIGIVYTEYDANAQSPYGRNPENPDWPRYRADADCYVNTNWFGGVWCASVLCNLAACEALDISCKFNTRQYYGLIDNAPDGGFFRQPVWFAWKLLQDVAGLVPGASLLTTEVSGPTDQAEQHLKRQSTPWVEAYAVKAADGLRLVLINRSLDPQGVQLSLAAAQAGPRLRRYLYSEERLARFIGPAPGSKTEGAFQGAPDDSANLQVLSPLDELVLSDGRAGLTCPPVSITILRP